MSMQTNIQYGYGIITTKIKITDVEKIKAVLQRLPDYEQSINEYFKDESITQPTVEDFLTAIEELCSLAEILETLIYNETGLLLYSCNDDNGYNYLLYPETYPWALNEIDLTLTESKLKSIFEKYVALLTDSPIQITYQRCENFG